MVRLHAVAVRPAAAAVTGAGFGIGVAAADFDNDGFEDLFIAGVGRNILYRNRGDGTFEDITARAGLDPPKGSEKPWSVSAGWFDYDNDGFLDLFVANGAVTLPEAGQRDTSPYAQRNQLFHNEGGKLFREASAEGGAAFARSAISRGAAFGDVDNDGAIV